MATDTNSTATLTLNLESTPRRWRYMRGSESAPGYIVGPTACSFVAQLLSPDGKRNLAREDADAELIVRAVNNHEALVAALEQAKRDLAKLTELCEEVIDGSVDASTYPDGPCLDRDLRKSIKAELANQKAEATKDGRPSGLAMAPGSPLSPFAVAEKLAVFATAYRSHPKRNPSDGLDAALAEFYALPKQ